MPLIISLLDEILSSDREGIARQILDATEEQLSVFNPAQP